LKPLDSILIKPSGADCNLDCKYCFYLEKSELYPATTMHRMSDEVLSNLMQQLMEQSTDHVSIAWQGGEPTLMGLSFYKNAVVYQQKFGHGQRVATAM